MAAFVAGPAPRGPDCRPPVCRRRPAAHGTHRYAGPFYAPFGSAATVAAAARSPFGPRRGPGLPGAGPARRLPPSGAPLRVAQSAFFLARPSALKGVACGQPCRSGRPRSRGSPPCLTKGALCGAPPLAGALAPALCARRSGAVFHAPARKGQGRKGRCLQLRAVTGLAPGARTSLPVSGKAGNPCPRLRPRPAQKPPADRKQRTLSFRLPGRGGPELSRHAYKIRRFVSSLSNGDEYKTQYFV